MQLHQEHPASLPPSERQDAAFQALIVMQDRLHRYYFDEMVEESSELKNLVDSIELQFTDFEQF